MRREKRKLPIFDIILTSLTLILIAASAYLLYLYKSSSTAAHDDSSALDQVTSTIDETNSNFKGIKIISEISNDKNVPFAIQYPQSSHTEFNDKVKKYIKKIKHDYLTNLATHKQKQSEFTNELNISFETFAHPNGTYSFVFLSNQHIQDYLKETDIYTVHLNNDKGKMLTLKELVNNPEESLQRLSKLTKQQIENDETLQSMRLEEIEQYTKPVWENFEHFIFTEEALVLYLPYDKNKNNIPIIPLSYDKINDLLVDDYKVQVKEESENETPSKDDNTSKESDANAPDSNENPSNESTKDELDSAKKVALTFDDGPDPEVTTRILKTLEKYDAKATFFMLGSRVEYYPEIAKMVEEAGHELGNHSWTHPDLTRASTEKIYNEISRTSQIIEEVTGEKPYSFRPPYGAFNDSVRQQTDLPIALWDVDTLDWKHRNPQQLLSHVQNGVKDGSVILMHDIHASTADGLDAVMAYLQENGYTFVTFSEIEQQ